MSYPIKKDKKYIPKIAQPKDENITDDDDGPLTADFIKLQRINPPAVAQSDIEETGIGIGKASKLGQLLKDPYKYRPKSYRTQKKKGQLNTLANNPQIRIEVEKEALKQQEKLLSDAFIKPLTEKGIKVNNIRTIYRK